MATADDRRVGPEDPQPAEVLGGLNLVSDLQSQVVYLRHLVEDLNRENESLRSKLSNCRCSKEKDENLTTGAFSSFGHEPKCDDKISRARISQNSIITSNHLAATSTNDGGEPSIRLGMDKSAHGLAEGPGDLQRIQKCSKRFVALKVMYFGKRFYGFASEAQMDPTIESEIFKALARTNLLIANKDESHYSRCGRTDKGVSSCGQVIALYVRSNLKSNGETKTGTLNEKCEIDYVKVLNRVLPEDIRVMGWCPVPVDFHARFSCLSREYRYLFWKGNLDISAMQKAAEKFIGEYDFRNFCKMDAINVNNYQRKITFIDISPCKRSIDNELWSVTIKGSAFLWHQVRCMVAVLFMVGQRLESPDIVDTLLDINKTPRKPQYNLASELPLILLSCEFESLKFLCSPGPDNFFKKKAQIRNNLFHLRSRVVQQMPLDTNIKPINSVDSRRHIGLDEVHFYANRALCEHLKNEFKNYMLQAAIFHEARGCLPILAAGENKESRKKGKGHIPLMRRATEPSYEERRAKLSVKNSLKS